jgi:hypothetical protein
MEMPRSFTALLSVYIYSYDGKTVTCNLFELSVVKNGKNAMLFERPDTPCCIPHLRRRGI